MITKVLLIIVTAVIVSNNIQARPNHICDKAQESIPVYKKSKNMFHQLFNFYKKYNSCIDGAVAEGIAAVTIDTLNKDWKSLSEFNRLTKKNNLFKDFIISNINPNVTGQEEEVNEIISKTKLNCDPNLLILCEEIRKSCLESMQADY